MTPDVEDKIEQPIAPIEIGEVERTFHRILNSELKRRNIDFSELPGKYPGIEPEKLIKEYIADPLVNDLRRVVTLGLLSWNRVKHSGVFSPPDDIKHLYELLTNPGARVAVLESIPRIDPVTDHELVGAVITLTKKEHFISKPPIDIDRHGARIWVNDEARVLGPRGTAAEYLLSDSIEQLGEGRIGTRVVVDVEGDPKAAHIHNIATYSRFGFSRTGLTEEMEAVHNGKKVKVTLEWMVYPPLTEEARAAWGAEKQLQQDKVHEIAKRIGQIIPHVPAKHGVIMHIGSNRGAGYDIASVFSDIVLNVSTNLELSKKAPETLRNLYHFEQSKGLLSIPDYKIDSAIVSEALKEITARGEGYSDFLARLIKNLNGSGSRIILRESESEIRREDAEQILRSLGLRILSSRLEDEIGDKKGRAPAFIVCAEVVGPNDVVEVRCGERKEKSNPSFVKCRAFKNTETGEILSLAGPDGQTIETAPILPTGMALLAEGSRPHLTNPDSGPRLDRSGAVPFVIEQLAGFRKAGDPEEEASQMLTEVFGLSLAGAKVLKPHPHLTLPMELGELCTAVPVELENQFDRKVVTKKFRGLENPWRLKEVDAVRFLQADTSNARAARAIYIHSLQSGRPVGPWYGSISLKSQGSTTLTVTSANEAITPRPKAIFEEIDVGSSTSFYQIKSANYREFDAALNQVGSADIEYVVPSSKARIKDDKIDLPISSNSILLVPYIVTDSGTYIGLARRHSPAVQLHSETLYGFKSSDYVSMPLFSLPTTTITPEASLEFACKRLQKNFGTEVMSATKLGPSYLASSGLSLRLIDTYAVMIDQRTASSPKFKWSEVSDCLSHFRDPTKLETRRFWVDGPTLTGLFRFSHAAGKM